MNRLLKAYRATIIYLGATGFCAGLFWSFLLIRPEYKAASFSIPMITLLLVLARKNGLHRAWKIHGLIGHFTPEAEEENKAIKAQARTWASIAVPVFSLVHLKEIVPEWFLAAELAVLLGLMLSMTIVAFLYERQLAKAES